MGRGGRSPATEPNHTVTRAPKAGRSSSSSAPRLVLLLLLALVGSYCYGMAVRIRTFGAAVPQSPGAEYMSDLAAIRASSAGLTEVVRQHKFLVIGGTGFTGSALVEDLLARGAALVRVMGRSLPPAVQYPYGDVAYPVPGVDYVRGDVTSPEALDRAMQGVTVVIHTAAHYGSPMFGSNGEGRAVEKVNVQGMKNIVAAAERAGVRQVIYTCTSDVTFIGKELRNVNETHPFASIGLSDREPYATGDLAVGDHYARTKIEAEKVLLGSDRRGGLRTISLRPNGIYGPGENSAFRKAVGPAYVMGSMPAYFDDQQTTDWVCTANLVYAHLLAVQKLHSDPDGVGGRAYYITDGEYTNNAAYGIFEPAMNAVGASVVKALRVPPSWLVATGSAMEHGSWKLAAATGFDFFASFPAVAFSVKETLKTVTTETHDISRARRELGYQPPMPLARCQAHTAEEWGRRLRQAAQ
eukprot:TRINITY_DN3469_c4_g1_i1.p1 TRINITY_DN3469_c4_g1~~TRINITY_DN3469_c4_g1_i1.p1  ORF type:complete len:496 (+),score=153.26 TRINITY_DN3469_c4_g1_i1:85-1488(+)